jgi:putative membrane-bound dehydrogenase-like protein
MRLSLAFALAFIGASSAFAQKEYGFDNRKASGQPYLKPEESVARMKVADGFEVKLFAAEPQLVNPIAMTVDEKGRVWVVECFEYPKRTAKGKMPRDRIKILEDTDGDGVCDKVTTFIEGKDFPVPFDLASGIEVGNGGVYLGAPPYLFFIENKNDKPGKIEILLKGFGSQDTHETLNTFQWGPDGRLYGLHGVFTYSEVKPAQADGPGVRMNAAVWRYDTRTKKFEVFAEGTSNPWGMDWRNTDGQFILCCCVIPHLFHMVPGGNYIRQGGLPSNPYAYGEIKEICDHTFHKESGWAHAGLISLDTPLMPEKYRNSVIFGSIHGCSIKQNILKPNGSSYIASRGDDFLVSGDKNFRPINLRWGPNGEIYCIDWHDQNPCHQAAPDSWDYEHGRVYRIQSKGLKTKKPEDLAAQERNWEALARDPNPYIARTAVRLLRERFADNPVGFVNTPQAKHWTEIQALHAIGLPIEFSIQQVTPATSGPRAWTVRLASEKEKVSAREIEHMQLTVERGATPEIRREMASAAIRLRPTNDVQPLIHTLLGQKGDAGDPIIPQLLWVAYEPGLTAKPNEELTWLKDNAPGNELIAYTMIPRAMRRLVATGKAEDLAACVAFLGDLPVAQVNALEALVSAIGNRTVDAPKDWKSIESKLTANENADVRRLANSLAVKFRDPEAVKKALAVARDTTKETAERVAAVRDLGVARDPATLQSIIDLARRDGPSELRAEAVRALGGFDSPKLSKDLLGGEWSQYTPALKSEVVNVLAGRKEWAADLLAAVAAKTLDRRDLNDNTILRIQALRDNALNTQIEKVWGRIRSTPAELNQLIDKMRGELAKAPGSFDRGKLIFDNQCAKCHKFDGRGHEVGPNIEGAGRDIEYLLVNVLDPNRVIGAPYFMRTVNLLNMQVKTGVLHAEDGQSITLKTENGVLEQIQKKDIDDIKVQEKSLMPEGLANNMSVQDFRDLVRYVMANPFIQSGVATFVNQDSKNSDGTLFMPNVGVSGRIALPDMDKPTKLAVNSVIIAPENMKARLLVGSRTDYIVSVDDRAAAPGKGSGGAAQPDQSAVEVTLRKGENHLRFVSTYQGRGESLYLRFHDPDRKLRYPESGVSPAPK